MHIPDGVLDPLTCVGTSLVAVSAVGYAVRRVGRDLPESAVPLMGVTAASVFAAQMLNFPIPGGASGHFLGGVLAAILLGPWAGMLVMTVVLLVQCFMFQDGGVSALGANVLNMAVVGSGAGYAVYNTIRRRVGGLRGTVAGAILASWFAVIAGAILCSVELALGGHYPLTPALGAMLLSHSVIGLGEAAITGVALGFILRTRPDLVYGAARAASLPSRSAEVLVAGLIVAVSLAAFVSPFASSLPDGLAVSLSSLGWRGETDPPVLPAPMPSYAIPGIEHLGIAGSIAGVVGTLSVFALAFLLARHWPWHDSRKHLPGEPGSGGAHANR